jgi:hypothetical protein
MNRPVAARRLFTSPDFDEGLGVCGVFEASVVANAEEKDYWED